MNTLTKNDICTLIITPRFSTIHGAGDAAYIKGYIMSVAGAVTNAGSDGKTLLHCVSLLG